MFRRLPDADDAAIEVTIDGRAERVRAGDTVAAALFSVGIESPRTPYCMMGICFECLVVIDGVGNRQGCLVPIRAGMRIETRRGKREVDQ